MALTTGPLGGDCVQGYGDDVDLAEAPGPAGDRSLMLEQLLSERWSCRAFEDREVPDQTLPKSRFQTLSGFSLCVTPAPTATGRAATRR